MIPHNRLSFGQQAAYEVADVVASGWVASGSRVERLEKELARVAGRRFCRCVGSGLGAIRLALQALGVGSGDEVVIPAYSCVALANAVLACGAKPVAVDIAAGAWNLDPKQVRRAANPKTKAVIAVHTFGLPAPIHDLASLNIPVIEDCAHTLGIEVNGKAVGSLGAVAISSFYATKLVGGGEGGAVFTDKKEIAEFVSQSRDYDEQAPSGLRLNDKMNDMEAALALTQLRDLERILETRAGLVREYDKALRPVSEKTGLFRVPAIAADRVWYRYAVEMVSGDADRVIDALQGYGVEARKPVTDWRTPEFRGECPVTDRAYALLVSLPLYPTLTAEEQQRVCEAFRSVVSRPAETSRTA
jgi:perosamine synthetase